MDQHLQNESPLPHSQVPLILQEKSLLVEMSQHLFPLVLIGNFRSPYSMCFVSLSSRLVQWTMHETTLPYDRLPRFQIRPCKYFHSYSKKYKKHHIPEQIPKLCYGLPKWLLFVD